MESIPLYYEIIFIVIVNTIIISFIAYLLCRIRVRKIKTSVSQTKLEEAKAIDRKDVKKTKGEAESSKPYQKPSVSISKKLPGEEEEKKSKKQKFLRYTPLGYIDLESDRNKKTSKWR